MIHPPADLAERAARQHVVVIGGGVAGLVAARECAKVGMPVTVLERDDAFGGSIRTAELDGLRLDVGAESFATRGGHVRELITELGLDAVVTAPTPGGAWLTGIPGTADAPLPAGGILGIPANPFQDDVPAHHRLVRSLARLPGSGAPTDDDRACAEPGQTRRLPDGGKGARPPGGPGHRRGVLRAPR